MKAAIRTALHRVLVCACMLISVGARSEPPTAAGSATAADARSSKAGAVNGGAISERSLYQLQSRWTTDAGQSIPLSQLSGQYQIVAFIFTHCVAACPLLVKSLQVQSRNMTPQVRERARFVLVSIDPQNDTVAALRRYRKEMGLDSQWTLLRGTNDDVRELAAVLGFNYDRMPDGQFAHSNQITLLDTGGEVMLQHPSADGAVDVMSAAIAACSSTARASIAGKNCH